jgi:hypothetical protein
MEEKAGRIDIPFGNTALVKKPSLFAIMNEDGNIPNSFYVAMFSADQKTGQINMNTMSDDQKIEYIKTMMYMADKVARESFVSPSISENPDYDNDEIALDDIDDRDKEHLLNWVMGGGQVPEVKNFPGKKRGRVATSSKK